MLPLHQVGAGATTYDRCKQSRERDVTDPKTGPAVGLLMTRPLPSARRFEAMGVVANGAELEDPGQVEVEPRQVALLAEE